MYIIRAMFSRTILIKNEPKYMKHIYDLTDYIYSYTIQKRWHCILWFKLTKFIFFVRDWKNRIDNILKKISFKKTFLHQAKKFYSALNGIALFGHPVARKAVQTIEIDQCRFNNKKCCWFEKGGRKTIEFSTQWIG